MAIIIILSFIISFSYIYHIQDMNNKKCKIITKTLAIVIYSSSLLSLYPNKNLYLMPIIYSLDKHDEKCSIYATSVIYLTCAFMLKSDLTINLLFILIHLSLIFGLHLLTKVFLNLHSYIKDIFFSIIISFNNELKFLYTNFIIHLLTLTAFLYIGNYTYKRINFPKDSLTNLREYGYLNYIDEKLSTNYEMFSVLFIDIDDFKQINDTYGHNIGNAILIELASFLKLATRSTDSIVRYGGEEFVIILKDTKIHSAIKIAERLRKDIENHTFLIDGQTAINITVSIGISSSNKNFKNLFDLIKIADQNLYKAKTLGKNRIYPFRY